MGYSDAAVPTLNESEKLRRNSQIASHKDRPDSPDDPDLRGNADYADFSAAIRRELAPATTLEDVMVDRVVLAAWRLQALSREEALLAHDGKALAPIHQETLRIECSLETALLLLEASRRARPTSWGRAKSLDTKVVEPAAVASSEDTEFLSDADHSNEWTSLPAIDPEEAADPEAEESEIERVRWEDRLAFDENISETSPVVRGTWVTANQVVSRIVDGWSWSDVLRAYPELIESDIRACLAYTVDQDEQDGY